MLNYPFKEGDKIRCIEADAGYGLLYDSVYTVSGYGHVDLVKVKELDQKLAWYNTRFELFEEKKSYTAQFKVVKWNDWCEAIRLRIAEELKQDEGVAEVDLEDLIYGPALDPTNPSPFCKFHMFHNIYENNVFVEDHKEKDCWWYINSDADLIYKPQLA